jgi:hypothetical protein
MALVECPDCGRPVSSSARVCPHCGAVLSSALFPKFVVVLLAAVGVVAFFEWKGKQQQQEEQAKASLAQAAKAEEGEKKRPAAQKKDAAPKKKAFDGVQRATLGAKALKKTIANPAVTQLESARVIDTGAICYEYRTLNNFGGYTNGKAVLAADGKQIVNSEMSGFGSLWESECAKARGTEVAGSINWYDF